MTVYQAKLMAPKGHSGKGQPFMVTAHLRKGKAVLIGLVTGVFSLLIATLITATPAHAASTVNVEWVNATTIRLSGSALKSPVDVAGDFVGNVYGTPPGSQTFMAGTNGPVEMSFGCKVSMTLDIFPDASGKLDYSKGELIFTTSSPSTCSQDTLKNNIGGLTHDPNTGTANISLQGIAISGVDKRGPAGGNDTGGDPQNVNVTAGMGPASDYDGIPATDTFMLCEAKGDYTNNIDALYKDCLDRKTGTLSANPLTSNNLETIKDGKGPGGGDEKGWKGQFKNVKAGIYVVCSTNFKACQLFTKNPGQAADVYVIYGSTAGSTIPGTPPGQGGPDDQKVCTTGDGLAGALAWVLCPAVQLIASATNFFENNIIIPFMTVSPLTTNADNPIYILWQDIRNVANIGFILFFFIVIFSQATSIGISNYGIKRILPKMAFVVVGVNLSYFIVAFVIDAFNIFGAGISSLVMAALTQANTTQLNSGTSSGTVRSIFTLGGAALITIVVSGGAAIGWFFSFLGLALLVVVVVVMVLVVRQMAIIMLVILAPIAILMYMLPNTEGYFNKWRKTLIQLLMMYPMIVLLFAAGKIFGIILQQPDFKIAGDGVSDDVAQAVRVILQFVVYVIPLVFLPATFAASGALMGRAYGFLHNARTRGLAQRGGKAFNEGVVKPRRAEMRMRAARRGGPIGWAAGYGYRRDFKKEQRERELGRARQEYLAGQASDEGFAGSAAGIGGESGRMRVQANAQALIAKAETEDLENAMALLTSQLKSLNIDQKNFAGKHLKAYLENPSANSQIKDASGKVLFDFAQHPELMKAAVHSAASQGEVGTVEAARISSRFADQGSQAMLDDVIRRNDGKLKEKGGYHLATNFNLGQGRMVETDKEGKVKLDPTTGQPVRITDPALMQQEMQKQRILAISQTGASSIAGMKAGLLHETASLLADPAMRGLVEDSTLQGIYDRMEDIARNPTTLNSSEAPDAITKMRDDLKPIVPTPRP
jgi:hypothetical protein